MVIFVFYRSSTIWGGVCGTWGQDQFHSTYGATNPTQVEFCAARTSHSSQEIRDGDKHQIRSCQAGINRFIKHQKHHIHIIYILSNPATIRYF